MAPVPFRQVPVPLGFVYPAAVVNRNATGGVPYGNYNQLEIIPVFYLNLRRNFI